MSDTLARTALSRLTDLKARWEARFTAVEADVATNTGDITALDGRIDTLEGATTAWQSFTPSWVNVTLGTGPTSTGYWRYVNGDLEFVAWFILGTGGSVTGNVTITLPNSETGAAIRQVVGSILCSQGGPNYPGVAFAGPAGTSASLYVGSNDVAATNPFTWAVGGTLDLHARVVLGV